LTALSVWLTSAVAHFRGEFHGVIVAVRKFDYEVEGKIPNRGTDGFYFLKRQEFYRPGLAI
jgi:hypothetical protein